MSNCSNPSNKPQEVQDAAVIAAAAEAEKLSANDLRANQDIPTGACCLYTANASRCVNGISQDACQRAAGNSGTSYKWTSGKLCDQLVCP